MTRLFSHYQDSMSQDQAPRRHFVIKSKTTHHCMFVHKFQWSYHKNLPWVRDSWHVHWTTATQWWWYLSNSIHLWCREIPHRTAMKQTADAGYFRMLPMQHWMTVFLARDFSRWKSTTTHY